MFSVCTLFVLYSSDYVQPIWIKKGVGDNINFSQVFEKYVYKHKWPCVADCSVISWQYTMSTGHIETYEQIEIQTQRSWVCLWQGCISIAPRKISAASDNLRFIVILRRMQLDTVYSVYTVKHWSWVLCHLCCLSSTFIHLAQSSFLTIVVALSVSQSQFLQPSCFKCG